MNTPEIKGITIYGGSCPGHDPAFVASAEAVGKAIAASGRPLIYGGGRMGMMGTAAHAAMDAGGTVVAVIPQFMVDRGWNDPAATRTIVTAGMHPRKELMADLAQGIIALPGGIGTFEELSEIITWRQLGLFKGNIVILNISGYYDNYLAQIEKAIDEGFLPADHRSLYTATADASEAVSLACISVGPSLLSPKF